MFEIYYIGRPLQNADLELGNCRQNIFPSPSLNLEGEKKEREARIQWSYTYL